MKSTTLSLLFIFCQCLVVISFRVHSSGPMRYEQTKQSKIIRSRYPTAAMCADENSLKGMESADNKLDEYNEVLKLSLVEETVEKAAEQAKTIKKKGVRMNRKSPRELTGLNFKDSDGEYDVPIISKPSW